MKEIDNYSDCPCFSSAPIEKQYLLEKFESIREKCPALMDILVPDDIWPHFKNVAEQKKNEAKQYSILLSALHRGYLKKITSPVHKYLIKNERPNKQLKSQYKEDLIERWMISRDESKPKDELKRHQELRGFLGKLTELQVADWLEACGWNVENLEALCGKFDIEASSPKGIEYAIEIKYIGQEDDKFLALIDSDIPPDRFKLLMEKLSKNRDEKKMRRLIENSKSRNPDYFSGSNYVLFRAYEAAKQLQKSPKENIVIIVISHSSWHFLEMTINDNWINWQQPNYLDACPQWDEFILEIKLKYPKKYGEIEKDLQSIPNFLNNLLIMKQDGEFNYSLEKVINFNS